LIEVKKRVVPSYRSKRRSAKALPAAYM